MPSLRWRQRSRAAISTPALASEQLENDLQLIAGLFAGKNKREARSRRT
jgi:hypothetical protein